jgi:hypothetical protein
VPRKSPAVLAGGETGRGWRTGIKRVVLVVRPAATRGRVKQLEVRSPEEGYPLDGALCPDWGVPFSDREPAHLSHPCLY